MVAEFNERQKHNDNRRYQQRSSNHQLHVLRCYHNLFANQLSSSEPWKRTVIKRDGKSGVAKSQWLSTLTTLRFVGGSATIIRG